MLLDVEHFSPESAVDGELCQFLIHFSFIPTAAGKAGETGP